MKTQRSDRERQNSAQYRTGRYARGSVVSALIMINLSSHTVATEAVKNIGPEYYSSYGNSQVGKGAVDRFKVR